MKNPLLILVMLLVFATSCQENENPRLACGVENPAVNLTWLSELIDELEGTAFDRNYSYINQVNYQGQVLFVQANCCPNCNSVPIYYDCEGNVFEDENLVFSELTTLALIWKSESSLCTVGT
ncbi:hypothetical protein [Algoriphagus sp.]|uniref:hypothetical protein n=1 Tax=Algoriphagus sp. TaxID=1872435 RepID=UPI002619A61C|nr:hypothetical protein [Algoriphagus sp.]